MRKFFKIKFNKKIIIIAARPKTFDIGIINNTFYKECAYAAPDAIDPEVIFDIGANIGIISIYYSLMYPRAKIYSFEPLPENYELLKMNAALNSNKIVPIQKGLGSKEGYYTYYFSNIPADFGGGGFKKIKCNKNKKIKLLVTTIGKFIREAKIKKIDILKIDTEGMEFDIITAIPRNILKHVKFITGECHGIRDLELFLYLSEFFNLGFHKMWHNGLISFKAVNKKIFHNAKYIT
ncbi:MAG: FkbM family methyltransferase [Candidatus Omnitrophota bacterium]|nr:FkbM family methyltransferase [Candidatus Omnitrophota bacterium]